MAGAPEESGGNNSGHPDNELTTEQGRIVDAEITQKLFIPNGLKVVNDQISLPDDFPMTGHPDGELEFPAAIGRDERDPFGVKWGYEHKQLGRWAYETVFKKGFEQGEPGYLCQTVTYGMALGWDAAYIVCMAQDASSTRSDARMNLGSKNPKVRWANQPGWNPKMLVYGIDLRPYYDTLGKRLLQRAEWLTDWFNNSCNPAEVKREANPESDDRVEYDVDEEGNIERRQAPGFPCGWCPWMARCIADGDGGRPAPELPFKLSDDED